MKLVARISSSSLFILSILFLGFTACAPLDALDEGSPKVIPPAKLYVGSDVSGAWVPNVTGAGSSNERGSTSSVTSTITLSGVGMARLQDSWGSKEVTVDLGTFDANTDFGYDGSGNGNGSMTLTAETVGYPYSGGAYPVLTSFKVIDGATTTEFVNLKTACSTQGMFVCAGGWCSANTSCGPQATSSFFSRDDWDQHQLAPYGYASVNSFPRCDSSIGSWACPSGQNKLPSGHYYAKYILMSDRGVSVASASAGLQVKMTIKKDTVARNVGGTNGAIDLNVVLIGSKNINDSHTAKGAQNLDLLFEEVNRILDNGAGISIGNINVYEWRDEDGGDYYSQLDYSLLGELFASGSKGFNANSPSFPAIPEGSGINIFMLRDIEITGVNYSILGLSGAISGPPVNGTQSSGLAFSTNISSGPNGVLSEFNASCAPGSACSRNSQDSYFLEMGATVAHELGHYMGLNHPSEKVETLSETQRHDQLTDTPTCAPRSGPYLDQRSCYLDSATQLGTSTCSSACDTAGGGIYYNGSAKTTNFCPAVAECQFNHVMWYTTKIRSKVSGVWKEDGNQFSAQSSALLQWNPFVK